MNFSSEADKVLEIKMYQLAVKGWLQIWLNFADLNTGIARLAVDKTKAKILGGIAGIASENQRCSLAAT